MKNPHEINLNFVASGVSEILINEQTQAEEGHPGIKNHITFQHE